MSQLDCWDPRCWGYPHSSLKRPRDMDAVTESEFLCKLEWVIVNSGMRNTVCRKLRPALRGVFREFDTAARIVAE